MRERTESEWDQIAQALETDEGMALLGAAIRSGARMNITHEEYVQGIDAFYPACLAELKRIRTQEKSYQPAQDESL